MLDGVDTSSLAEILLVVFLRKDSTDTVTNMKQATKDYADALVDALQKIDKELKYKLQFKNYKGHMVTSALGSTYYEVWYKEVKYCHLQKYWDCSSKRLKFNLALGSGCHTHWTSALKPQLLSNVKPASERRSTAPNGDLEERIQQLLITLGESVARGK